MIALAVGVAIACVTVAIILAIGATNSGLVEISAGGGLPSSSELPAEVVVEVGGAVVRPGVYHLPGGSRVADAIEAAGGYGPRVAADRVAAELELAAPLDDGGTVVVPSRDDPPVATSADPGGSSGGSSAALVDLNHATAAELEALPGIGPVTAAKIIEARAERPFASVDDLRERGLVGAKTFERLRDLVTVR
jgi:competence protein ComEA